MKCQFALMNITRDRMEELVQMELVFACKDKTDDQTLSVTNSLSWSLRPHPVFPPSLPPRLLACRR